MSEEPGEDLGETPKLPEGSGGAKLTRAALDVLSGAIPFIGGAISAVSGAWSEREQDRINKIIELWLQMLKDELREKEKTIAEMLTRIDLNDEKVNERIQSPEYQSLLKKTFREWGAAESEEKRVYVRNILSNAAATSIVSDDVATSIVSDDVVRLFIDWIRIYSNLHFKVMSVIYNNDGITRRQMWSNMGKPVVREDSADADLFKLVIHDLSTGHIIRQHREVDYYGNFVPKTSQRSSSSSKGPKPLKSAFDSNDQYELTGLGKQFIHYAMNELAPRITFSNQDPSK